MYQTLEPQTRSSIQSILSSIQNPVSANPTPSNSTRFLETTWKLPVVHSEQPCDASIVRPLEMPQMSASHQVSEMHNLAVRGRLTEAGVSVFRNAWTANGVSGIAAVRDQLNMHLEKECSNYSVRTACIDHTTQQFDVYIVLMMAFESLDWIVTDLRRNGANSDYANRAFVFKVDSREQIGQR